MTAQRFAVVVWSALALIVTGACSSEPEAVIVGDAFGETGEVGETGDGVAAEPSALPTPSQWWVLDESGTPTTEALSFYLVDGDALIAIAFTDGCVRTARPSGESALEVVGPVDDGPGCTSWVPSLFVVGEAFRTTVVGDRLTIEIGGEELQAVAIESVSNPEPVARVTDATSVSTTTLAPLVGEVGVTTTFGPEVWIDPIDALIVVPGGRWGDEPRGVTSPDVDQGADWQQSVPRPIETADCDQLVEMIEALPPGAAMTARDEGRAHDLDHRAFDLGPLARTVAEAMDLIPQRCTTIPDGGETLLVEPLDLGAYVSAMALVDENGRTAWVASDYRNNVFSMLTMYETGDDKLTAVDLDEFTRLIKLAFDELANG